MQVAWSRACFDSIQELTEAERGGVLDLYIRLERDQLAAGANFERVKGNPTGTVFTCRVNQDLRAVLHKEGGTVVVLHVAHHQDAYRWAENVHPARHPKTGEFQLMRVREVEEVRKRYVDVTIPRQERIFKDYSGEYLLSLGVPERCLEPIQNLTDKDDLLAFQAAIPEEVLIRLIDVASGVPVVMPAPARSLEEAVTRPEAHSEFAVLGDEDLLRAALSAPFDRWIGFLHPSQRAIVDATPSGPMKVTGSAGTGKSVVALHRARALARRGCTVLLTTYTNSLVANMKANLTKLCTEDELDRIRVASVLEVAVEVVTRRRRVRFAPDSEVERLLGGIVNREAAYPKGFLRSEWENVVQAQGLTEWEQYRKAKRTGRGTALTVAQRRMVWALFEELRSALQARRSADRATLCAEAERYVREGKVASDWDAVIVDEIQDLRAPEVRLAQALCAGSEQNLLLTGDAGQRIYPGGFSLRALGINVRGRSHVLRINYRTTAQIRGLADVIGTSAPDDLDGGTQDHKRVLSLRTGPVPTYCRYGAPSEELDAAARWITQCTLNGIALHEIACLARTNRRVAALGHFLDRHRIAHQELGRDELADDAVVLGTMHRAKGLEFRAVLVYDCGEGSLPPTGALEDAYDDKAWEDLHDQDRQLLYVAMTRARDILRFTWSGPISSLAAPLVEPDQAGSEGEDEEADA